MDLASLRNIGVAAHIDAGKTTVSERMLFLAGVEHRVGQVDEGTAVLDWMAEERERGITITAAATRLSWRDAAINLIDTPGHVDFTVEVERCMRVLDGAVLVVDAVAGVQAQTETVWRQMARHTVPSIAFVNKCDRIGADFLAAVESLRARLGAPAVPVQYPIYEEEQFVGVIDIVERRALAFDGEGRAVAREVPAGLADEAEVLRAELLDALGDGDDEILALVLEDKDPPVDMIVAALRARTIAGSLQPVLCGAALRGIGVEPVLDAAVAYLPSPLDRPAVPCLDGDGAPVGERAADPDAPLTALAFKLHIGPHGDQTFVRVYSGKLSLGQKLWNPRVRRMERPARILRMHADSGEALEQALAGDIVALTGLKLTGTGDTLCERATQVWLEPPTFPEPVIALVVEPASSGDRDKLRQALARLEHEDPSFRAHEDESAGQWRIEGMGELHLEVLVHRLQQEFRVEPRVGKPRVSYREAVRSAARGSSTVDRTLGGKDVYARVELELVPEGESLTPGIQWDASIKVSEAVRPAIEAALSGEAQSGPRFGFPLVGAQVRLATCDPGESESEPALAMAATEALRQAMGEAEIALLEPMMAFEVDAPEEFASGILADMGSRRADVSDVVSDGDTRTLRGTVPLAQMFGYSTVVRSLSQGRASFGMTPAGFIDVPEGELEARGLVWS